MSRPDLLVVLRNIAKQGRIGGGAGIEALAYITSDQADTAADVIERLQRERDELEERMSWVAGHDRQGLNHLADAVRLAEENDDLRAEVARHHEDFEKWEEMAASGAGRMKAITDAWFLVGCAISHTLDNDIRPELRQIQKILGEQINWVSIDGR